MKLLTSIATFLVLVFLAVGPVRAAEKLVFDSTNNYLGGCQLTNKSNWELKEEIKVAKFEVWYNWNQGESSLPVKVTFNGETFAQFEAIRGDCDPYQKQWCNADYQINKVFPKGTYATEIPNARQCLKPGGTGAIRLYADDGGEKTVEPTPVATAEPKVVEPKKETAKPSVTVSTQPTNCSCNQTTVIAIALATSVISSLLVSVLLKKLG